MLKCDDIELELSAYQDGALPTPERANVESHLATCAACQAALSEIKNVRTTLSQLPKLKAPARLKTGIREQILADMQLAASSRATITAIKPPQRSPWTWAVGLAAALMITMLGYVTFIQNSRTTKSNEFSVAQAPALTEPTTEQPNAPAKTAPQNGLSKGAAKKIDDLETDRSGGAPINPPKPGALADRAANSAKLDRIEEQSKRAIDPLSDRERKHLGDAAPKPKFEEAPIAGERGEIPERAARDERAARTAQAPRAPRDGIERDAAPATRANTLRRGADKAGANADAEALENGVAAKQAAAPLPMPVPAPEKPAAAAKDKPVVLRVPAAPTASAPAPRPTAGASAPTPSPAPAPTQVGAAPAPGLAPTDAKRAPESEALEKADGAARTAPTEKNKVLALEPRAPAANSFGGGNGAPAKDTPAVTEQRKDDGKPQGTYGMAGKARKEAAKNDALQAPPAPSAPEDRRQSKAEEKLIAGVPQASAGRALKTNSVITLHAKNLDEAIAKLNHIAQNQNGTLVEEAHQFPTADQAQAATVTYLLTIPSAQREAVLTDLTTTANSATESQLAAKKQSAAAPAPITEAAPALATAPGRSAGIPPASKGTAAATPAPDTVTIRIEIQIQN